MTLLDERSTKVVPATVTVSDSDAPEPETELFAGRRAWWAALGVAILSWDPGITRPATASIDDSWRYLLQTAARDGADFGRDITFTYGPLLHLDGGPTFSLLGGLSSVLVALTLSWATALLVIRRCTSLGMRWWSTLLLATVVTIVLIPPLRFSEAVALVAAAWLLAEVVDDRVSMATQYKIAVLSGIWLLVKPSAAVVMAVVVVAASVASAFALDEPLTLTANTFRLAAVRASAVLATVVITAVGGWLLMGQELGLIGDYLLGAREIAGGFAEAMSIPPSNPNIEIAFIVLGLALGGYLGWLAVRLRTARTVFAFALTAVLLIWARQIALGRPGWSHLKDGGVALGLIGVALWPLLGRRVGHGLVVASTVLTVGILLPAPFYQTGTFASVGPFQAVVSAYAVADIDETVGVSRTYIAAWHTPEDHVLDEMQDRKVFFSPYLGVNAFAQDMDFWFPPAVQSYASFTEHLEERSAAALLAPDGPEVILHQADRSIDGRRPAWESPRLVLEMFCGFDPVATDATYTLLERVPETCTSTSLTENVPVVDRQISVPSAARDCPGLVTFRTFGAEADRLEQIAQLLRRPAELEMTIDAETWRVIPGTLSQPHVVAAPRTEHWIGKVPVAASAPSEVNLSTSFDARGPLTTTFECWTTQPSPDA